ncbi:MAG TPA: exodeoxyribonuclease VII small subunit [Blastocatellia bacterium]|nr:exodeoxyribonuclease VII small subunit [Blastocatellia bacterium]
MNKNKGQEQSFESSLASLERIVANLESGDLPLERALELFEEGVALARRCQTQLGDAERKVEMLLRERGEIKVVPFEASKDAPAGPAETTQALSAASVTSINSQIQSGNSQTQSGETPRDESRADDSVPF